MKHKGFDLESCFHGNGHIENKERQIEMLKRCYADFTENDWVLWIVADLYHPNQTVSIDGSIEIKKRDGSVVEKPIVTRRPYPNKRISQISMKAGRKRLYGIPLVFKSFEELSEISDITIRWDIFEQWYLDDIFFDLHSKIVVIDYHLSFEKDLKNLEHRFYTVFSKDNTNDPYDPDETEDVKRMDEYYNEFDSVRIMTGVIDCFYEDNWVFDAYDSSIFIDSSSPDYDKPVVLSERDEWAFEEMSKLRPDEMRAKELLQEVFNKQEVLWYVYRYEKSEVLTASYMLDILASRNYGFKSEC